MINLTLLELKDKLKKGTIKVGDSFTIIEVPEGFKKCYKCHEIKVMAEFHKDKNKKDGVANKCRRCAYEDNYRPINQHFTYKIEKSYAQIVAEQNKPKLSALDKARMKIK